MSYPGGSQYPYGEQYPPQQQPYPQQQQQYPPSSYPQAPYQQSPYGYQPSFDNYPPAPRKRGVLRALRGPIIGLSIAALVVGGIVGYTHFFDNGPHTPTQQPYDAKVGDCMVGQDEDSLKRVDTCAEPHDWKVVGRIDGKTEAEFYAGGPGGDVCKDYRTATASFWEGETGRRGYVLCLAPDKPTASTRPKPGKSRRS